MGTSLADQRSKSDANAAAARAGRATVEDARNVDNEQQSTKYSPCTANKYIRKSRHSSARGRVSTGKGSDDGGEQTVSISYIADGAASAYGGVADGSRSGVPTFS